MPRNTIVYWIGIIGIPGKGPNWMEPYNGARTLGELIVDMEANGLGEVGKTTKIFKFIPGDLNKFDLNNPHWPESTTMAEYVAVMGDYPDNVVVYVMV
jgi:hypothetical protein